MGINNDVFELRLFVSGEKIAESKDVNLCLSVLSAIKRAEGKPTGSGIEDALLQGLDAGALALENKDTELTAFSRMLGVDVPTVQGACDPRKEEPYMHLDIHHWASWKKNMPARGRNAVSPAGLSATLMTLWFQTSELGTPTVRQCQKVLSDIGLEDKHPSRAIGNCEWLQFRGAKTIRLNPSEVDKAVEVAKAFCERRAFKLKAELR